MDLWDVSSVFKEPFWSRAIFFPCCQGSTWSFSDDDDHDDEGSLSLEELREIWLWFLWYLQYWTCRQLHRSPSRQQLTDLDGQWTLVFSCQPLAYSDLLQKWCRSSSQPWPPRPFRVLEKTPLRSTVDASSAAFTNNRLRQPRRRSKAGSRSLSKEVSSIERFPVWGSNRTRCRRCFNGILANYCLLIYLKVCYVIYILFFKFTENSWSSFGFHSVHWCNTNSEHMKKKLIKFCCWQVPYDIVISSNIYNSTVYRKKAKFNRGRKWLFHLCGLLVFVAGRFPRPCQFLVSSSSSPSSFRLFSEPWAE